MQPIDIVFFALLGLLTLRCFLRGFTGEIIALASFAFGITAAVFFFRAGAAFIRGRALSDTAVVPEILAFAGIFFVVFVAGKILDRVVRDIIDRLHLDGFNRFLGFILGFVEGVALVSVVLLVLWVQPLFDSAPLLGKSFFARTLLPFIAPIRESVLFADGSVFVLSGRGGPFA
ncbi:MAG: CvpA family protein [Treponema sp.]|jgi:membrane protein required for colicin V production|nr:CvpA family protein [Treponema sp.]